MKVDEVLETERPPHRILVVEDDPMIRNLNTTMLMDAGCDVDAAPDGAVAWDTLQRKTFDLLITDHSMPRMTGLELIEKVRAAGLELPVIMVAGVLPKEAFIRSPRLQPAATVIKPYTHAEFLGAVRDVLLKSVPTG